MFSNASSSLVPLSVRGQGSPLLTEVTPSPKAEHDLCSYCGKVKYVAYRIVAGDGGEAVACFPCSDQGMNWLEQNFPAAR